MDLLDRITIEPGVRGGRPCLRNTRISVVDILDFLASGMPIEEILEEYESLERDDVVAALTYASRQTELAAAKSA